MNNQIPVIIDKDPYLRYEKRNWTYFLMVPVMFILTFWVALKKMILGPNLKTNTFWFDGISSTCRVVKENARRWKALDIVYNYKFEVKNDLVTKITNLWLGMRNAQAVRNRLKLVKKKLREEIERFLLDTSEVRLLSIASGSAQGVIEVMNEFKERGVFIKAIFLDLDSTAIEYSKALARAADIINQITFINKSARELEEAVDEFRPHIVEMVGFLDYRPREKAIELIKKIHRLLAQNGTALISNIAPNLERWFLSQVLNWPMIYRNPKQLAEVVVKGEFKSQNCNIICEPLKIQGIAICRKR